jgi:hypothetical protein
LGISSMEFCERFNFQTRGWDKELLVHVRLNVFSDKSFNFSLKQFQLRDLASSFNLDIVWVSFVPTLLKCNKNRDFIEFSLKNKNFNEFLLSLYKSFLVFNSNGQQNNLETITYRRFLKLFFAYLKSYQ